MNNSKFKTWCVRSIWGKALRDGAISMAESTWYKYARKLGYSEARNLRRKLERKVRLMRHVLMKLGTWIFHNTKL